MRNETQRNSIALLNAAVILLVAPGVGFGTTVEPDSVDPGNTAHSRELRAHTMNPTATVSAEGGDWVFTHRTNGIPYRIHVFTNTTEAILKVTGMGVIDYLVVGGGAGGGYRGAGGGGAGGVILRLQEPIAAGDYPVTVGKGGQRQTVDANVSGDGKGFDGEASSFYESVALGGGGAGMQGVYYFQARPGGSGGGKGIIAATGGAGAGLQPIQPGKSEGFGNDGFDTAESIATGGGGAGEPGGVRDSGRSGGRGIDVSHLFTNQIGHDGWVGGGGAGSGGTGGGSSTDGSLGGGGGSVHRGAGKDAMPATGGGGGGGASWASGVWVGGGGAGGSGLVVIRYEYYPGTVILLR